MKWRLILEEFSPELIYIKGSKNIVADAFSHLDRIDNVNNENNDNKVEPTWESLSANFTLNNKNILHPTNFKKFQQKDKCLIEIAKENAKVYSIKCILLFVNKGKLWSQNKYKKAMLP